MQCRLPCVALLARIRASYLRADGNPSDPDRHVSSAEHARTAAIVEKGPQTQPNCNTPIAACVQATRAHHHLVTRAKERHPGLRSRARISERDGSHIAVILFGQVQVYHRFHPRQHSSSPCSIARAAPLYSKAHLAIRQTAHFGCSRGCVGDGGGAGFLPAPTGTFSTSLGTHHPP